MKKLAVISTLLGIILLISCKQQPGTVLKTDSSDTVSENKSQGMEIYADSVQIKTDSLKELISYKNNNVEGVIFTKKYYKNNPNNFTPTKQQLDEIEELILQETEDFSSYYRQYDGVQFPEDKIKHIHIQLIPKDRVEKGDFQEWKRYRIGISNLTIGYDLNTKELRVPKLSGINF